MSFRAQSSELRGKAGPDEGGQRRLQLRDRRRVDESHGKEVGRVQELESIAKMPHLQGTDNDEDRGAAGGRNTPRSQKDDVRDHNR